MKALTALTALALMLVYTSVGAQTICQRSIGGGVDCYNYDTGEEVNVTPRFRDLREPYYRGRVDLRTYPYDRIIPPAPVRFDTYNYDTGVYGEVTLQPPSLLLPPLGLD